MTDSKVIRKKEYDGKATVQEKLDYWNDQVDVRGRFSLGLCWLKDWEEEYKKDEQSFDCEILFLTSRKEKINQTSYP